MNNNGSRKKLRELKNTLRKIKNGNITAKVTRYRKRQSNKEIYTDKCLIPTHAKKKKKSKKKGLK